MGAIDDLLGPATVEALGSVLGRAAPGVAWDGVRTAAERLDGLSIRARADVVAAAVVEDLVGAGGRGSAADAYAEGAALFRRALADEAFTGWMVWPAGEAVVTMALADGTEGAFDDCLLLLRDFTPRLTSEFPIRRLLRTDLDRALGIISGWTSHADEHVRRLASEGTRSYLPWAVRVPELLTRPEATVPVLDRLRSDPSEYVRRSVANHLNDLARHAPDLVVATASRWLEDGDPYADWVVRHGLRTLVKKAHPGALALLGFRPATIEVGPLALSASEVELPSSLEFAFTVTNGGDAAARLAVDYVVHYVKASGLRAEKVFKLATVELDPGETRSMRKLHAFRQMTTRVHYAGRHALEVQINGERAGLTEFDVLV